jgi:acyl-CoA synthetase (AMP-forming)/AMP-acid ligase II
MIAIALLGAAWLKPSKRLARGDLKLTHILLDTADPALSSDRRAMVIDRDWTKPPEGDSDALLASFPGQISSDDLAVISESSGTTGTSKLIPLTYGIRSKRTFAERAFESAGPIISLNMFPVTGAGTSNIDLRVLMGGGTTVHGGGYRSWCERDVTLVSASPAQVVSRIFGKPAPEDGEPRIPRLWVRGSKPSRQFFENALAYFDDIVVGYGATEVGGIFYQTVTRDNVEASGDELGSIFPYARVEIVDDQDGPLPMDTPGIVRIQ